MRARPDILMVDNYDSFTHNAVDLLTQLGASVEVARNDALDVDDIRSLAPRGVVLSPGPGRPRDAGVCLQVVEAFAHRLPILGICLGHQVLAEAFGGRIVRAQRPLHGTATPIAHKGRGLLRGLPRPFFAARYHSLVVDPARHGAGLEVTCTSEEGEIMGLRLAGTPTEGVQFHPESYLTPEGHRILAAFLRRCGLRVPRDVEVTR